MLVKDQPSSIPTALTVSLKLAKRAQRSRMFVICFLIPNILSIIFFFGIATPVYRSTASITVFNPSETSSSIVSLLAGGSSDGSAEEAYILRDYIMSWSEFQKLNAALDLAKIYSHGDFVTRYGGLWTFGQKNDVALWHYYQGRITIGINEQSGVVDVSVGAYNAATAQLIAKQILSDAVAHMDAMNRQQEQDFVDDAVARQTTAGITVNQDETALDNYRSKSGVYDPSILYTSQLDLLNTLTAQETQLEAQYNTMSAAAPNSPSAHDLVAAIKTVRDHKKVVQTTIPEIADKTKTYERLLIQRNNDQAVLQQASEAVQEAELKAKQNRYYLDVISAPSQPDTAEYPKGLKWQSVIFLVTLLAWGLLR